MTTYFDIIMIPLQLLIVFFTIYYFTLSFFGLVYRKNLRAGLPQKRQKSL